MSKLTIAVYSIVGITVIVLLYKYVFNPQMVLTPSVGKASQCPVNWSYSAGLCHPEYGTSCMPFDPSKITSAESGCSLARTCGTDWSGMCP